MDMKSNLRFAVCIVVLVMLVIPVVVSADTFYADTSADGAIIYVGGATFASKRGASSGTVYLTTAQANGTLLQSSSTPAGVYYRLGRFGWSSNTSDLPDDCTIDSAIFGIRGYYKENSLGDFNLALTGFAPDDPTTIEGADFNNFIDGDQAPQIPYANINDAGYNNFTLTDGGIANISKIGYTSFMVRTHWDANNTAPSWISNTYSQFGLYDSSYAGIDYDPYLVIEYESAGGESPVSSFTVAKTLTRIPVPIKFNDTSTESPTQWNWSWGDGTWTNGTTQNATHKYVKRGMFPVFLLASNGDGSNTSASQNVRVVGYNLLW